MHSLSRFIIGCMVFFAVFSSLQTFAVPYSTAKDCVLSDSLNNENAQLLLAKCRPEGTAMSTMDIGWIEGIKQRAQTIADALIWLGSLLSVGAIVIGWFLYASSMGSDEKVKKGKNAVIYGLIGLLVMMFSFPVVNAIIEFIYTANN